MIFKKLPLAVLLLATSLSAAAETKSSATTFESVVLSFANNSHELNSEEMTKLKKAVETAKLKGKIAKVEVAVWSDKEHPTKGKLPRADEKLASERIHTLKDALKQNVESSKHIEAFNMAENVNWLGRLFHSDQAKLDQVFSSPETKPIAREDFSLIKKEGAPSKAVVILKLRK